MLYQPETLSANIVVLGAFNPAIFSPDWLEGNQLIGPDDAKAIRGSDPFVITRQLTLMESETFRVSVDEHKYQIHSKGVAGPPIRDLTVGALELLAHTPLHAIGFNFDIQYRFRDVDAYHKVGDTLAPKEIWDKVVSDENRSIGLDQLRILVQDGRRNGKLNSKDTKTITVQRGSSEMAIRLSYNDHHDLVGAPEGLLASEFAVQILVEQWEEQLHAANQTFNEVIELAVGQP